MPPPDETTPNTSPSSNLRFGGLTINDLRIVRDPRTGKILYFLDPQNRAYDPETGVRDPSHDFHPRDDVPAQYQRGPANATPASAGSAAEVAARTAFIDGNAERAQQINDALVPGQTASRAADEIRRAEASTARNESQRAELRAHKAWIDGQYMNVTPQPDGTWVTTPVGNMTADPATVTRPTAFDALDGSALTGDEPFLMTNQRTVYAQRGQYGSADAADRATTKAGAEGYLTIKGGVAWLAELSTKDNAAYRAMLDKLVNAGYLTAAERTAAGGQWSTDAGNALARAARDVAVVNTTDLGKTTTLDQWLQQKADAGAGADTGSGGSDNLPVTREYTDPEQIKASAKSAAEQALGRKLTDAEEAELVGHFRSLEDGMYDQIDAARAGSTGGGSYVNPSPTGQINQFLDTGPREQEQANWSTAQYGEALLSLFGVHY